MGRPFVTGRIQLSPAAERQLDELDNWIAETAAPQTAERFVSSVLNHIANLATFPPAGRSRDDIHPGLRTSTFKKRTLIAYVVHESPNDPLTSVVGVFHGGQDWERAVTDPEH